MTNEAFWPAAVSRRTLLSILDWLPASVGPRSTANPMTEIANVAANLIPLLTSSDLPQPSFTLSHFSPRTKQRLPSPSRNGSRQRARRPADVRCLAARDQPGRPQQGLDG